MPNRPAPHHQPAVQQQQQQQQRQHQVPGGNRFSLGSGQLPHSQFLTPTSYYQRTDFAKQRKQERGHKIEEAKRHQHVKVAPGIKVNGGVKHKKSKSNPAKLRRLALRAEKRQQEAEADKERAEEQNPRFRVKPSSDSE